MNVIFNKQAAEKLNETYTLLPLPPITQTEGDKTITVEPQVVLDMQTIPLQEISSLEQWTSLHKKVVENHIKKDYNFCKQAIEHLMGNLRES